MEMSDQRGRALQRRADDAAQGVTQVLRGRDLVNSTARQLALYRAVLATLYPAWRASRGSPLRALRHQ